MISAMFVAFVATAPYHQVWLASCPLLVGRIHPGPDACVWAVCADGRAYLLEGGHEKPLASIRADDVETVSKDLYAFNTGATVKVRSLRTGLTLYEVRSACLLPREPGDPVSILHEGIAYTIDESLQRSRKLAGARLPAVSQRKASLTGALGGGCSYFMARRSSG
jgi:hypothetical protein